MRSIRLRAVVPTDDTALVFKQITDFPRYSEISQDVRSVTVDGDHSEWEVNFRRGIMCWTERDVLDPAALTVVFEQTEGDFQDFHGRWELTAAGPETHALFEVTYDFGIESLAGIMDPLAERVIKRAICGVLAEISGEVTIVEGGSALVDLGELPPESGIRVAEATH